MLNKSKMKNYFITATDTDAGKTFVACALIQALKDAGKQIAVYKPVAAGCIQVGDLLINEDAELLTHFANCGQSINEVNPIALAEAIAPHIAAKRIAQEISLEEISSGYHHVLSFEADINITEGAGGWRLPLNVITPNPVFLSDFAINTNQDVILVVNMKLGCLNHAILSYQAIIADGLNCVAWIANCASDSVMSNLAENIASLEQLLPIPKIAQLTFFQDPTMSLHDKIIMAAKQIDLTQLSV